MHLTHARCSGYKVAFRRQVRFSLRPVILRLRGVFDYDEASSNGGRYQMRAGSFNKVGREYSGIVRRL
jgi:hypothetical protein